MPSALWARITIGLAAAAWLVVAILLDVPDQDKFLKSIGGIASVVVLALMAFDRFAWRWLPESLVRVPKLYGTWRVEIKYRLKDDTESSKFGYMVIRQTFSAIECVGMHFEDSESASQSSDLRKQNGNWNLWFAYWSRAGILTREDNSPHKGGVELRVGGGPNRRLIGEYWTDRGSCGTIAAWNRVSKHSSTYGEGVENVPD
ncbi:MAG: hypothetical protein ACPHCI_01580 [Solirubrobacterales bacterium]